MGPLLLFPVCSGGSVSVAVGAACSEPGRMEKGLEGKPCREVQRRRCLIKPGGEAGVLLKVGTRWQSGFALGHTVTGWQIGTQN